VFEGLDIEPKVKESLIENIRRRLTPKGCISNKQNKF
jgi:hypothetical protein